MSSWMRLSGFASHHWADALSLLPVLYLRSGGVVSYEGCGRELWFDRRSGDGRVRVWNWFSLSPLAPRRAGSWPGGTIRRAVAFAPRVIRSPSCNRWLRMRCADISTVRLCLERCVSISCKIRCWRWREDPARCQWVGGSQGNPAEIFSERACPWREMSKWSRGNSGYHRGNSRHFVHWCVIDVSAIEIRWPWTHHRVFRRPGACGWCAGL